MIRHMRHGSPPRLMALHSILSPNRRESLPTPSAGVRIIADLAGPGRCPVENAAARARLAVDHVSGETRARVLVPDLDELERVNAGLGAVLRIQRDRAMVVQIGACDPNGVKLRANNLQHRPPLCLCRNAGWPA